MNYHEIIVYGLTDPEKRKNIKEYLIRHYNNAKKEDYSDTEFFDGCDEVVNYLEESIEADLIYWTGVEVEQMEGWIKKGDEKKAEISEKRLDDLNFDNSKIKILGRWVYGSDITFIREALKGVESIYVNKKRKKSTDITPLNFELNQSEVIYLFDILQDAGFIKPPKYHDGSYYRKLEHCFTARNRRIKDPEQKRNKYLENGLSTAENMKSQLIDAINKHG